MSTTTMTGEEMFDSLTGFDEIAIDQAFGEVGNLAAAKPTMFLRAMVFVHLRREGKSDAEAKQGAMGMSLKDCNDYFAEDPADPDPEDPDSEVGKDDAPPE